MYLLEKYPLIGRSREIYTIKSYNPKTMRYTLSDKKQYDEYQLQKITEYMSYIHEKKVYYI